MARTHLSAGIAVTHASNGALVRRDPSPGGWVRSADPAMGVGVPLRLAALASVFVVEMLAFTAWLDTETLSTGRGLVAVVADSGPTVLRVAVAAAVLSLVFGKAMPVGPKHLTGHRPARGLSLPWLAVHATVVGAFAGLSAVLFERRLPAAFDSPLVGVWLIAGATAAIAAAFASLPPRSWAHLLRTKWPLLIGVVSAGALASVFGWLAAVLWQPMSRATLAIAFAMLHPFVPTVTADAQTFSLGTREFSVLVSRACSGSEGLGLMLVFTSMWLWLHRADWRFPRALLLVPVGLALVWLFNCLRIAGLVFIGVAGAPGVALGGFHSQAGWLGFNAVAIGVCLAARRMPWLMTANQRDAPPCADTVNPTATYVLPFLALLAGAMVAALGTDVFEWLYGIRVVSVGAVLWWFRHRYRALDWRVGWAAVGLGGVVFVIWLALEPLVAGGAPSAMPAALMQASQGSRDAWLALRVLGAVIAVPLAEELAFRGFLMRRFESADFEQVNLGTITALAIVGSSVAFGMLHGDRWLAGTLAGLVYAAAYLRRGSIGDAIAAHATTNACIAVSVLGAGQWHLW